MKYIKMFESFLAGDRADAMKKIETAIIKKKNIVVVMEKQGTGVIYHIEQCFENVGVDFITWKDNSNRNKNPKNGEYAIIYYNGLYDDDNIYTNLIEDIKEGMLTVLVVLKDDNNVSAAILSRSIIVNM